VVLRLFLLVSAMALVLVLVVLVTVVLPVLMWVFALLCMRGRFEGVWAVRLHAAQGWRRGASPVLGLRWDIRALQDGRGVVMLLVLLELLVLMMVLRRRCVLGCSNVDFVVLVVGKVVVMVATPFNMPVCVARRVRSCIEIILHLAPRKRVLLAKLAEQVNLVCFKLLYNNRHERDA
jgi:hypothetical protein